MQCKDCNSLIFNKSKNAIYCLSCGKERRRLKEKLRKKKILCKN
jgi:hypothetical protein